MHIVIDVKAGEVRALDTDRTEAVPGGGVAFPVVYTAPATLEGAADLGAWLHSQGIDLFFFDRTATDNVAAGWPDGAPCDTVEAGWCRAMQAAEAAHA